MRRSLLARLLGLSLIVALCSIAATAWLTTRTTSEQLRGEYERTLEADTYVYQQLLNYAHSHDTWAAAAVDTLVADLAQTTGRRVALAASDGTVFADSAPAAELPATPTAAIDTTASLGTVSGGSMISGLEFVQVSWRLTEDELENRENLAAEATACLTETYGAGQVVVDSANVVQVFGAPDAASIAVGGSANGTILTQSAPESTTTCLPPELFEPSEAASQRNAVESDLVAECMDEAGAVYETIENPHGFTDVVPSGTSRDDFLVWEECSAAASAEALSMFTAPPVVLYTGSVDTFDPFSGDVWQRTALAALAVLAVGSSVTVVAGRRLTKPVRSLIDAVQRMTTGDRAARVPARGRDEMARLGHAFNEMAESIGASEEQRRAMVSDVAHELRTPLANVRGYLEAAQDGVVPLDAALVDSLLEESTMLHHLIEDLQDLALADAGKLRLRREPCDAAELARQVVAAHQTRADEAGVTLALVAPGAVAVSADPLRLRQALANLVANAVRYTPHGGSVTVQVGRNDDFAVLAVTDTGPGIAPEHQPHVFERFYRVDESRTRTTGGSGLGLAITKYLTEAHAGSVSVSSEFGAGATFTLRLPC